MQLSISTNFADVQRQLKNLQADIANKATSSAANKIMAIARTAMSREIRTVFNLSAGKVREKLVLRRASLKGGQLRIEAALLSETANGKRRSINLINFAAREVKAGVSVKVKRGGGRKVLKGAFIGNQGRTVFQRVGPKRLPIKPLQTIDVPQMFNTRTIKAKVVAVIRTRFPDIWAREVAFYTRRLGSRG